LVLVLFVMGLKVVSATEAQSNRSEFVNQYLDATEQNIRSRYKMPDSFMNWLNANPDLRAGFLTSYDPVDSGTINNLARQENL